MLLVDIMQSHTFLSHWTASIACAVTTADSTIFKVEERIHSHLCAAMLWQHTHEVLSPSCTAQAGSRHSLLDACAPCNTVLRTHAGARSLGAHTHVDSGA